jgi:prohibitin 2
MKAARTFAENVASRVASARSAAAKEGGGGGSPPGGGALSGLLVAAIGLGGVGYVANESVVIIQPGRLGVVYNRVGGLNEKATLTEGLNFVIPWFQRPVIYDIRTRSQVVNTSSGSKDLQMVQISLRVLFKPNPTELSTMYRTLGQDFDARLLPSIVNEITKAVVAKYNASELLTKRDQVSLLVRQMLLKRAAEFNVVVDDVSITHLAFSKDYTAAVEAKQVAQQDAERSKYIVDKAKQEKLSIIIKADGEAKAAALIGNAIKKNPAFLQLRTIDAAKDVAQAIVSGTNKVYLDSDSLMLNNLGPKSLGK